MTRLRLTGYVGLWGMVLFAAPGRAAGPAPERFSYAEPHMGTKFQITLYAAAKSDADGAAKAAFARVAELNRIMSDYDPTSELMRLCAKAGGPPVPVSPELFLVLERAGDLARRSGGAFDVTVGPVVRLWRRARRTQQMPAKDELDHALSLVGYDKVTLDPEKRTVRLAKGGMQLDLGGIAKGYAADEMLAALKKHGIDRALVAAGGDIACSGPPPGKDGWEIAIAPLDESDAKSPRTLRLHDAAVSTSGDAEQFVEINGTRYSHIVDPHTGIGLVGRMSVTVIAPQGITADSHTKVVAVLGPERGLAIIDQTPGVAALYVRKTDAGREVFASRRFKDLSAPPKP
jgi:thiamine biosynthesis lipoprotein